MVLYINKGGASFLMVLLYLAIMIAILCCGAGIFFALQGPSEDKIKKAFADAAEGKLLLTQKEQQLKEAVNKSGDLEKARAQLDQTIKDRDKEIAALKDKVSKLEAEGKSLKEKLDAADKAKAQAEAKIKEMEKELTELRAKTADSGESSPPPESAPSAPPPKAPEPPPSQPGAEPQRPMPPRRPPLV